MRVSRSLYFRLIELIFAPNFGERTWTTCSPQRNVLPVLKLNHELGRIATFYKQAAFSPDTGFAHIQNLARRREAPPL